MEKEIGKMYIHTHDEVHNGKNFTYELIILCTGQGKEEKQVSGVVVKNTDITSDFKVGDYSETWTWMLGDKCYYEEYKEIVTLDNKNICVGDSPYPSLKNLPKETTWEVTIPPFSTFEGPECCKNCSNNPKNNPNASGICNCSLPSLEDTKY